MLLQSVNHVVGDEVAFVLAEPMAESSHQLARPHERECERKPEHVATGFHGPIEEQIKNESQSPFLKGAGSGPFQIWRTRLLIVRGK